MAARDRTGTVPILLGVDAEPDDFSVDPTARPPWRGFQAAAAAFGSLRPRLAEATGQPVHYTWFIRMDAQIAQAYGSPGYAVETHPELFDEFARQGDAIALHPHAWRWQVPPGRWINEYADQGWVEHVMRMSFETYETAFGRPCTSHRFGDWYISPRVVAVLRELGVRYDFTIEPGAPGTHADHAGTGTTGRVPDHAAAPRQPYRPSDADPMRPANGGRHEAPDEGLWIIPGTSFDGDSLLPPWRRIARRIRDRHRPRHRPMGLGRPADAARFWQLVERHLDEMPAPYLSFMFRSDAAIRPLDWARISDKLETLMRHPLVGRLRFTTPDELMAELTDR